MMAERGVIVDRLSGINYTSRTGCPLVAQGTGVIAFDSTSDYWNKASITSGVGFGTLYHCNAAPTADRFPLILGNGLQHHTRFGPALFRASLDGGANYANCTFMPVGRGPVWFDVIWNATAGRTELYANGTLNAQAAVAAASVPAAGTDSVGRHGSTLAVWIYSTTPSAASIRSVYVRDFARVPLWQWTPHREFAAIATGTTGGNDDWYCPVGGAGLSIVWRTDLSEPAGGHLALTADAGSMARIEFPFRRPVFGSWLVEYEIRNPAFGADGMIIGLGNRRGVDPTVAGSNAYWINQYNNGGGWWRTSLYLANGAQIDGADTAIANAVAGRRGKILLTHAVNGDWQVWGYLPGVGWYWTQVVGNDVSVLEEGFITLIPRSAYVERVTYFQGEMTPHELEVTP
jgi:hypothetical protein